MIAGSADRIRDADAVVVQRQLQVLEGRFAGVRCEHRTERVGIADFRFYAHGARCNRLRRGHRVLIGADRGRWNSLGYAQRSDGSAIRSSAQGRAVIARIAADRRIGDVDRNVGRTLEQVIDVRRANRMLVAAA